MINHARTLLMNRTAGNLHAPGEEFIPPDFRPVPLEEPLASVRTALFGASPDRMYLNYRMQQFMGILHAAELAEFVTDLDPRLTYWPPRSTTFFNPATYVPLVMQTAGELTGNLQVINVTEMDEVAGRMVEAWQVTIVSGNEIAVQRFDKPFTGQVTLNVSQGTSAVVQLPGSHLQIIIGKLDYSNAPVLTENFRLFGKVDSYINNYDRAMYLTPPYSRYFGNSVHPSSVANNLVELIGATWHIEVAAKPTSGVATLTNDLTQGLPSEWPAQLFGLAPVEPYKTFQKLWNSHPCLPYRLGGLLLALIYQTEKRR